MADIDSRISKIKKKLVELDYAVKLQYNNGDIRLIVPGLDDSPIITLLEIGNNLLGYKLTCGNALIDDRSFPVPNYAMGSVIFADAIVKCHAIGYNPALIIYQINDEEVGITQILDAFQPKLSKINNKKRFIMEYILEQLVINGRTIEIEGLATMNKVVKGYQILLTILGLNKNDGQQCSDTPQEVG